MTVNERKWKRTGLACQKVPVEGVWFCTGWTLSSPHGDWITIPPVTTSYPSLLESLTNFAGGGGRQFNLSNFHHHRICPSVNFHPSPGHFRLLVWMYSKISNFSCCSCSYFVSNHEFSLKLKFSHFPLHGNYMKSLSTLIFCNYIFQSWTYNHKLIFVYPTVQVWQHYQCLENLCLT